MKELLIATTNAGKFSQLRDALKPLNLALKSLADIQGSDDIEIGDPFIIDQVLTKANTLEREVASSGR